LSLRWIWRSLNTEIVAGSQGLAPATPIIVTLHSPDDVAFGFKTFYGLIKSKGFIIYPGKITVVETFRVGCIGQVYSKNLADAVTAMGAALDEMGEVTRASVACRLSA
jgi:2-aminoethylphosphonate-pyruvate transaminase